MKIGVLALQGAFREHMEMLKTLNVETIAVKFVYFVDIQNGACFNELLEILLNLTKLMD
jgi:glutamine amidotransferase PdxT